MQSEFESTPTCLSATPLTRIRRSWCACVLALCFTLGLAVAASAQARTQTVLHTFTGGTDGANPQSELIRDSAGNLYGTTRGGGSATLCGGFGCGTVFKIDRSGHETVLYRFTRGADGSVPFGGVIRDASGNLYGTLVRDAAGNPYGTTVADGNFNCVPGFGGACGTVFKLDPSGTETVLYAFQGVADGAMPFSGLALD